MNVNTKKLQEWEFMYKHLQELREKEKNLRLEICNDLFNGQMATVTVEIGNRKVKAIPSINMKVDEPVYTAIFKDLAENERACIRTKYEVNKRNLKVLDENSMLFDAITTKPGLPKLEITYLEE